MTYQQIEKLAEREFKKLESKIPVDVVKAAKMHDIDVYVVAMEQMMRTSPSGILASFEGQWGIFLNDNDSLTRQRFTIAHELGHFLLHKDQQFVDEFSAGETFYRDGEINPHEREANYFAACLLMPADEVEKIWPQSKDPKDAANRFQVSEVSMTYRLRHLNLITVEE